MKKDLNARSFFESNVRFADLVNGLGGGGKQIVKPEDICEADSQSYIRKTSLQDLFSRNRAVLKSRDIVRKVVLGMNFIVIGIENQENVDYSMVLRNMNYDAGEYDKQASKIKRDVRKSGDVSGSELMYGFKKDNKLKPVITFILYYGEKEWDGPKTLKEMLDMSDVPEEIAGMVSDYKMNLVEVRKLESTEIFKTDIKQVFDYIRCSGNIDELVANDPYYSEMEEDAFDMAAEYSGDNEMMKIKDRHKNGEKINMSTAVMEMRDRVMQEGIKEGISRGIYDMGIEFGMKPDDIIKKIGDRLQISDEEAQEMYRKISDKNFN